MKLWLKKAWKRFEAYQQKRADYYILQHLDDRELKDLGIGRGDIRRVIDGYYEGR
tara:strand:- start:4036 stop:4200 length:165 start_codon:yes stop_codon:yes gene_type:complete